MISSTIMRLFFDKSKKRYYLLRALFAAAVSLAFIGVVYATCGMWFEENDDVFLSEMLSGKITGKPEYCCTFLNVLIAFPIAKLYSLTTVVPWWGLFLMLLLFCTLFSVTFSIFCKGDTPWKFCISLPLLGGLYLACVYCLCQSQFTSAAMLTALAGYCVLYCFAPSRAVLAVFFVMEFVACLVRDQAMFVVQPMGLCFIGARCVIRNHCGATGSGVASVRSLVKRVLPYVLTVILAAGIAQAAQFLYLHADGNRDYRVASEARVYLVDYAEQIPYEQVASVLTKYGLTEDDYTNYVEYHYLYPDSRMTGEFYMELNGVLKEARKGFFSVSKVWQAFLQLLFTSSLFWHLHQLTLLLFLAVFVLCLVKRCPGWLFTTAAAFAGYAVGLAGLAYRNRFVLRVMIPYYYGGLLFASILLFYVLTESEKKAELVIASEAEKSPFKGLRRGIRVVTTGCILIAYLFSTASVGRSFYSYGNRQNEVVHKTYYDVMWEISEYCRSNPDKHFLLDAGYARYVSSDILESDLYQKTNYVYTGSWYSKIPGVASYCEDYLKDTDIYYPVYEAQQWIGREGLAYYAGVYGAEPQLDEKIKLTNGATLWIYRLSGIRDGAFCCPGPSPLLSSPVSGHKSADSRFPFSP